MAKTIIPRERNPKKFKFVPEKYNMPYKERCYQKDAEGGILYSGLGTVTYEYVYYEAVEHVYNINVDGRHDNGTYERNIGESRQIGGKSDLYMKREVEEEEEF